MTSVVVWTKFTFWYKLSQYRCPLNQYSSTKTTQFNVQYADSSLYVKTDLMSHNLFVKCETLCHITYTIMAWCSKCLSFMDYRTMEKVIIKALLSSIEVMSTSQTVYCSTATTIPMYRVTIYMSFYKCMGAKNGKFNPRKLD